MASVSDLLRDLFLRRQALEQWKRETRMKERLFLVQGTDILPTSGNLIGRMVSVYAIDEQQARMKALPWLLEHPDLTDVTVDAYPFGFTIWSRTLPGMRELPDPSEAGNVSTNR